MNTGQNAYFLAEQPSGKALSIFCGVCEYDEPSFRLLKQAGEHGFEPWQFHINPNGVDNNQILRIFGDYYYESFISSIFPKYRQTEKSYFNEYFAEHTHRLTKKLNIIQRIVIRRRNESIEKEVLIDYLDIFLFPGNIAIYSFKCDFSGLTYDDITMMINHIRNSAPEEFSFIRKHTRWLVSERETAGNALIFGNKLKSFTLVEMAEQLTEADEKDLLYDLATCSPVGAAAGHIPHFQPAKEYITDLWKKNSVNVFDNWKGMALFDSFTALFRKGVLNDFIWENAYFNLIFLHSIFIKHYLFKINKKFYLEETNKEKLEDEFYEFDQYFNFKQISFNFLPQIIYDRIRFGLDIDDELLQLQQSIQRANNMEKSRRDKKINDVLTIIALLTVFSIIWDVSEWIDKLFFNSTQSYNMISGSLTTVVIFLMAVFLFRNYKKKR